MTTPAPVYRPRDVVNAPEIKARIIARSAERGDSEEIAAWMANHFYRYVIGNFQGSRPNMLPIHDWREIEAKYPGPVPEWIHKALERLKRQPVTDPPQLLCWWIAPDQPAVLTQETRILEVLHARSTSMAGKLHRINYPQADELWRQDHRRFYSSIQHKLKHDLVDHEPDAVKPVLQGEHGVFVEFDRHHPKLRTEMAYESQMMRHCLGQFADRKALTGGYGEQYAKACEEGRMRLFSYRSGQAQPHITVSAHVTDNGVLRIDQIKGKQNRPPVERYHADVLALLNHLKTDDTIPPDASEIQLLRRPEALRMDARAPAWCHVSAFTSEPEQLWLLRTHPALLPPQHLESPLLQWLIAARHDKLPGSFLTRMPRTPAVQDALTLAGIKG